jgi:hypothetical protein
VTEKMRLSIVSPHLDDAVLSLGGLIHKRAREGWDVRVVTAFGNDPASNDPASPWEAASGFPDAAAAAATRRREDERACRSLGCSSVVLPLPDEEHRDASTQPEVWPALERELFGSDLVLTPGYPLRHPDHEIVSEAVWNGRHGIDAIVGFYVEQPYASSVVLGRSRRVGHTKSLNRGVMDMALLIGRRVTSGRPVQPSPPSLVGPHTQPLRWTSCGHRPASVWRKWRAIEHYQSQLPGLGPLVRSRISLFEVAAGGEMVCLPEGVEL